MTDVKRRIQYLFYLMVQENGYVRAMDLAKKTGVTERTIKSDIPELAEYAKNAGAELISKKGVGYRLIAKDFERVNAVSVQLAMHFTLMGDLQDSQSLRTNVILRRLIVEENYLTLDEIAEEMFLTKSSIREEKKTIDAILDSFHLRWKKKHENGPLITGAEINVRMLMLCVFENHFHEAMQIYQNEKYMSWFEYDEKQRYEIRHIFLRNLRESVCHIRDDHTQRLSRYLCLIVNRIKAGYYITFDEKQREYIRKLRQCQVSRKVFYDLMKFPGFENVPEDEVLAFGLCLAQWADISMTCDLQQNYSKQLKDASVFLEEYEKVIWREYRIQLKQFDNYKDVLLRGLIPLMIQKDFDSCGQPIRITHKQDGRISDCPLAAQMAYDAIFLFGNMYGVTLNLYNALTFSSHLHSLLLSVNYDIKPLRGLICNGNGFQSSYALKKMIEVRYPNVFEKLECYELYEMRGLKTEDYDCALMNIPYFSYKYDWPYLYVDTMPTQKQFNDIYNIFILQAVELDNVFQYLHLKKINVYRSFDYENEDAFIKLLSFKMGKDSEAIEVIDKSLHLRSSVCVCNKVCVLFVKSWLVTQSVFDVYELKNESMFAGENVKYIVVMSVDFGGSLQAARFVNDATYMFFSDILSLDKLVQSGNKEALIDVVRNSLKALPISLK